MFVIIWPELLTLYLTKLLIPWFSKNEIVKFACCEPPHLDMYCVPSNIWIQNNSYWDCVDTYFVFYFIHSFDFTFYQFVLGGSGGSKGGEKEASYLEKSRAFQSEIRMSVVVYPCRTSVALKKLSVLIKTDMHHSFQTYSWDRITFAKRALPLTWLTMGWRLGEKGVLNVLNMT